MVHSKGIAVTARLHYVQEKFGQEGYDRLLAALPADDRALIEARILPHAWVPFGLFVRVNVEADRLFGAGDLKLCFDMGSYGAELNLPRVFRLFYRLGTPMFIFGKAAKLWRAHYDSGEMVTSRDAAGVIHLEIRDFEEPHRAHCESVLGWMAKSVQLSGGKVLRAEEVRCRTRNDSVCELIIAWR
jgi:hypothetical protein